MTAERGWKRAFDEPIPLPRGREIVTLEDAGRYITQLSKSNHEAAEWQAAMEALILVAILGGPTTFCPHRDHESIEPECRTDVYRPESAQLGASKAEARYLSVIMIKPGIDADGIAKTEADHHMKCPGCGRWFDMRDLAQVFQHIHDAEIEIGEEPAHPRRVPELTFNAHIKLNQRVFLLRVVAVLSSIKVARAHRTLALRAIRGRRLGGRRRPRPSCVEN